MSRFEVELVSCSHRLNQEELIVNLLPYYLFNQYILGKSYVYNSVLGTMGKRRNVRDNHSHRNTLNLDSSLQLTTCLHVSHLIQSSLPSS